MARRRAGTARYTYYVYRTLTGELVAAIQGYHTAQRFAGVKYLFIRADRATLTTDAQGRHIVKAIQRGKLL